MTLASAGVVGIAMPRIRTPCAGQVTSSTTDQGTQQIRMGRIVAAGKLLVVSQSGLHLVKLFLLQDSRHLSYGYPLGGIGQGMSPKATTNGNQWRLPMLGRRALIAT